MKRSRGISQKENIPGVVEGDCTHHWIIDSNNVGRCIKPGCGAVRDFEKLRRKEERETSKKVDGNPYGRKGRLGRK